MRHGQRVPPEVVPASEVSCRCFMASTLIACSEHDKITPLPEQRGGFEREIPGAVTHAYF
jgi:hypothetical protein